MLGCLSCCGVIPTLSPLPTPTSLSTTYRRHGVVTTTLHLCGLPVVLLLLLVGVLAVLTPIAPCLRRDCIVAELKAGNPLDWSAILLGSAPDGSVVAQETQGATWEGERDGSRAYVCVATGDAHAYGCGVVLRSIGRTGTDATLHALLGPEGSVSQGEVDKLVAAGIVVSYMESILSVRSKSHWSTKSASKFQVWNLVQYSKIMFVDADVVVLKPMDALFDLVEEADTIAAPQDPVLLVTGPHELVSSLFVTIPSRSTYARLVEDMTSDPVYGTNAMSDSRVVRRVFAGEAWVEIPPEFHVSSWMWEIRHIPPQRLLAAAHSIHYSGGNKPLYSGLFGGVSACSTNGAFLAPLWNAMAADAVRAQRDHGRSMTPLRPTI